jgi:hypothetical protein
MLEQIFKELFVKTMESLKDMTYEDRFNVLISTYKKSQHDSFVNMLDELSDCAMDLEYYEICATIKKIKDEKLSMVD